MARGSKFRKRDSTIRVAKTKALISFAVTAMLICVFVFAYAKSRFSHDEAQITFRHGILFTLFLMTMLTYISHLLCGVKLLKKTTPPAFTGHFTKSLVGSAPVTTFIIILKSAEKTPVSPAPTDTSQNAWGN